MFSPRALLTEDEAMEIYSYKTSNPKNLECAPLITGGLGTKSLSKKYNISPKAIRDIWNHRTWRQATRHMWTDENPKPENKRKLKASGAETHIPVNEMQPAFPCNKNAGCYSTTPLSIQLIADLPISFGKPPSSFPAISCTSKHQQQHQSYPQETFISLLECRIGCRGVLMHNLAPITVSQENSQPERLNPTTSTLHFPVSEPLLPTSSSHAEPSLSHCPPEDPRGPHTFAMPSLFDASDDPFHFDWPHW